MFNIQTPNAGSWVFGGGEDICLGITPAVLERNLFRKGQSGSFEGMALTLHEGNPGSILRILNSPPCHNRSDP